MDDRRLESDVNILKRRYDTLNNIVNNLKNQDNEETKKAPTMIIQPDKFVDINTFTEFQKNYIKDNNILSIRIEENKRAIDELREAFKEKVNPQELRHLEEYMLNKLDEFKISAAKKFADKLDSMKNAKYLETQVSI